MRHIGFPSLVDLKNFLPPTSNLLPPNGASWTAFPRPPGLCEKGLRCEESAANALCAATRNPVDKPVWAAAPLGHEGDHACCHISLRLGCGRKERRKAPSARGTVFLRDQVIYALTSKESGLFPTTESFGGVTNTWHVLRVLTCPETSGSRLA